VIEAFWAIKNEYIQESLGDRLSLLFMKARILTIDF
jgi:hypothetical protein